MKYISNDHKAGAVPAGTTVRTTESTEAGHTGEHVQHVKFDNGAGVDNSGKIYDIATGTFRGLRFNAESPQVCSQPYLQAIAEGDISGHSSWEKIGYSPAATTSDSVVWSKGGAYVFPAAGGIQMAVASSDNTQDKASGTGALQVTIGYLDANYAEKTEVVVLNGTTRVNTVATDILRINSFRVTAAGTGGVPVGNISPTNTAGSVTYSYITAGYTRARNSVYTVPAGKTLYIVQATLGYAYATNQWNWARMYIRANQNNGALVAGIFYPFAEIITQIGSIPVMFESPIKLVQKVDLYVGVIASASGYATSVMRGWTE